MCACVFSCVQVCPECVSPEAWMPLGILAAETPEMRGHPAVLINSRNWPVGARSPSVLCAHSPAPPSQATHCCWAGPHCLEGLGVLCRRLPVALSLSQ